MDVLLVEDEPLVREILRMVLDEAGLSVAEAPDAEAGLAAAAKEPPPAVVVTDLELGPGMDGLALAAEAQRRWPGVGVVYMTGRPSSLDGRVLRARERFLPKPFGPEALVRAVQSLKAGGGDDGREAIRRARHGTGVAAETPAGGAAVRRPEAR